MDNPHLFTHLFHGGVIISSRKIDYDSNSDVELVKSLMQSQHKAVLKDLKLGTFDDKIDAYLGEKPDLLPRKAPDAALPGSTAPGESTARQSAHPGTISLDTPVPQAIDDGPTTNPMSAPPAIHLDIPQRSRSRVPTPIAVPVLSEDHLGDPMVTFNTSRAKPPPIPSQEPSGAYAISRPRRGTQDRSSRHTEPPMAASPAPHNPRPLIGVPAGKARNLPPGKPRSSVVVSRPAVVIGAPPRIVGERSKRAATRKARGGNLFGKDLISEKSLDEVIMAYLSEDGADD